MRMSFCMMMTYARRCSLLLTTPRLTTYPCCSICSPLCFYTMLTYTGDSLLLFHRIESSPLVVFSHCQIGPVSYVNHLAKNVKCALLSTQLLTISITFVVDSLSLKRVMFAFDVCVCLSVCTCACMCGICV